MAVATSTSIVSFTAIVPSKSSASTRGFTLQTSSLPRERTDVPDEGPAVVLGQVPPRWHGSAPGRDLPEDLAVRLVLNSLGRPVGRLRIRRDGGRAVALALVPVARRAVDLGELLALLDRLLVVGQWVLLR